ncbi:hypothetical protein Poli38472_000789 [Pythium oligandrum]|uniref:Cullin-5 n=1 Tax=Pythium oligandrum TaxID=41045 RepID=A0A8K1CEG8_PYTOL|nr:hypothetical protein Poli38472_000789 [Pythium oligandrum]|eukprot:TMW60747.1 hypothetical protein Poli38472_000789 [Pythium oligandrum]
MRFYRHGNDIEAAAKETSPRSSGNIGHATCGRLFSVNMSLLKASTVNLEKLWDDIQPPLVSLVSGAPQTMTNEKWLEMYTGIYKICTSPGVPQAEMLFFRLRGLLVEHVERIHHELRDIAGEIEFLKRYYTSFQSFSTGVTYISELFRYLNRYWITYSHCETGQAPVPGVYPVTELALHIWHDIAFSRLKKKLVSSVMYAFRAARDERSEFFEDGEHISNIVETYFALGLVKKDPMALYKDDLEEPFLAETASYYSALAKTLLSKVSISEYLQEVEILCKQEQRRCEGCMHRTTVTQARQTCCRVLVDEHAERICEDAETFLVNNQTQDLHRLFSLFSELPKEQALISFKNILKKYIEKRGLDVVRKFEHEDAAKNPEGYIEALVQVRNKYFELIKDAFGFHALMRTALDQACRTFANSHPRLPELLAKYTHYLMTHDKKRGQMKSPSKAARHAISPHTPGSLSPLLMEESLEKKIENIGVVFCLIDDKDVFKKYYAKFLAKRLIKGTSVANDLEVLLIQKLRDICGCDFVSKLQKMLKDKLLSKELLETFDTWLTENEAKLESNQDAITFHRSLSYHCDVLTAGAWPISAVVTDSQLLLPRLVDEHVQLFSKFYTDRSTGRKLLWVHHLSFGILQANCFDRRYEFSLSFYQMLILMQYNEADTLSESALVEQTNIPIKDLKHHLASLVKAHIIREGDEGNFMLDFSFSSKKTRISAVPSSPVESPKVAKATTREVEEDRKMALQAAIVRVMKTRRDILDSQLHNEVAEMLQSQFVPTSTALKQNIEILIQKEYLRRHESQQSRLLYVA